MQNLFVIDIDHTIVNTDVYVAARNKLIIDTCHVDQAAIDKARDELKKQNGRYTMRQLFDRFTQTMSDGPALTQQMTEQLFAMDIDAYYEGVVESLARLKPHGQIVLFSQGEADFQIKKIQSLIDTGIIDQSAVHIFTDKQAETTDFLRQQPADRIFFFDDHKRYLAAFTTTNPAIVTILIETQERVDDPASGTFQPTIAAPTFAEAVTKVEEMVKT